MAFAMSNYDGSSYDFSNFHVSNFDMGYQPYAQGVPMLEFPMYASMPDYMTSDVLDGSFQFSESKESSPRSGSSSVSTAPSTPQNRNEGQAKAKKKNKSQRAQARHSQAMNSIVPPPPLPFMGDGTMPSRGSRNHFNSQCRPCRNFLKPEGCPDGASCNFCHYPHNEDKFIEASLYSAAAVERRLHTQIVKETFATTDAMLTEQVFDQPWYAPMPTSLMVQADSFDS